jgi:G3E family GTPase
MISMHREIVGVPGIRTDHRNGDGLDNRRSNLRPSTRSQNAQNMHKVTGKSSRFKGVSWFARDHCWRSVIRHNGKYIHIGYFKKESDAANEYDSMALKLFMEFALTNKELESKNLINKERAE